MKLLTTSNVIWVLAIAGVGYGVYTFMQKQKKTTETVPPTTDIKPTQIAKPNVSISNPLDMKNCL